MTSKTCHFEMEPDYERFIVMVKLRFEGEICDISQLSQFRHVKGNLFLQSSLAIFCQISPVWHMRALVRVCMCIYVNTYASLLHGSKVWKILSYGKKHEGISRNQLWTCLWGFFCSQIWWNIPKIADNSAQEGICTCVNRNCMSIYKHYWT